MMLDLDGSPRKFPVKREQSVFAKDPNFHLSLALMNRSDLIRFPSWKPSGNEDGQLRGSLPLSRGQAGLATR